LVSHKKKLISYLKIMKKILMVSAMSTIFFACKNNEVATDKNAVFADTSLLRRSGLLTDTAHLADITNKNGITATSSTTTTVTTTTTTNRDGGAKATTTKKQSGSHASTGTLPAPDNGNNPNPAPVTVQKDRALSDAAICTAIGAGSGAIIGAIVSKDKVKGAVIGGVVGGAGGYAVGRSRDVKSGRVARKKNQ